MLKRLSIFIFIFFLVCPFFVGKTFAQETSSSLAIEVPVKGDVVAGDVICSTSDIFSKCTTEYQTAMYGIISDSSALQITDSEIENGKLIVTSGIVSVRVTGSNGDIKKGSLLTTSKIEGLAMLAAKNGYVLGSSLEDFSGDTGIVQAVIDIHPAAGMGKSTGSNLVQFIREGLTVPVFEPLESFRYLLAGLMIVIAFTMGLLYFGRSSKAGIEAIGRNPLAKNTIQFTTFINVLLTIVIVAAGVGVAYFILIL